VIAQKRIFLNISRATPGNRREGINPDAAAAAEVPPK
jgi:hypothetical protein